MPKRSATEALQAVVPAVKVGDVGLKSRSGRVVKPKVWDDGTLAAPLTALKEDGGEPAAERNPDADPDYSNEHSEERASGGGGGHRSSGGGHGGHTQGVTSAPADSEEDEEAYSDDSPRVSGEGSQGGGSMGRARSGSVGRDEHGKFTSGPRGPRGSRGGRGARGEGGGGIFKMAAVEVLRLEKRLMSTGEIARVALKRGLIKCTGKTPEATMASALYTDIKRKEGQSIFIRPHEGLFGLREWIEQGVAFQDEFAEEMAKRARAAFGAFVGMPGMPPMMGPMMDADGLPIANPYPPMMPFPGMPSMPGIGLPMTMGVTGIPGTASAAAAAAAAAKVGDDSADGLMELLSAAEELHKSSSKDKDEADVKYTAEGTAIPAAAAAAVPTTGAATTAAGAAAATATAAEAAPGSCSGAAPMDLDQQQQEQVAAAGAGSSEEPAAGSVGQQTAAAAAAQQADAAAAATSGSQSEGAAGVDEAEVDDDEYDEDEDDAAAMLAAVAEAAADEPTSRQHSPDEGGGGGEGMRYAGFPGFPGMPEGMAAGGMPYAMQYPPYGYPPYGYYPHPYMYQQQPAAGLPPLPKAGPRGGRYGEAEAAALAAAAADFAAAGSSESLDLVVRGSNRPFAALLPSGGANGRPLSAVGVAGMGMLGMQAAVEADGQEQVNILNLPLPEVDSQGNVAGHGGEGSAAPIAELEPAQLKEAEAQVMRLEKELGTSHPEVGKAYLSLSRLYLAGCEESSSKQLATAALSRAWEVMSVCQLALKKQPSCASSFTYLMDKIRTAQHQQQRPAGTPAAHGEAAHVTLAAGGGTPPSAAAAAAAMARVH